MYVEYLGLEQKLNIGKKKYNQYLEVEQQVGKSLIFQVMTFPKSNFYFSEPSGFP